METGILPPRYRGPQPIGRGGMGEIYRATDSALGRAVAVKLLAERYAQDEAVRARFTREALAAARLSGEPSTVTIFDVGEWNERPFIVMEYLSGGSLDDRLRAQGAQREADALGWLEQAALALDAAHAQGVVHRDVKPANLMLDRDGNVHVADFGIASAVGLDSMTMTGTVLGTAGYLSPEQAQGSRATPASDRYALGIVAFELLTGERPFSSESMTAEAAAHVHAPVPSVCDRLSSLPCELDPVFQRALAKDPDERYPTCAEFVADLRHALSEAAGSTRFLPPVAARVARAAPAPRRGGAWPLLGALAGAAALAGIVAAVLLTRDDGGKAAAPPTVVKTIVRTTRGTTVRVPETVTAPATPVTTAVPADPGTTTPSTPPTTTAAAPAVVSGDPHRLNDQGYFRMQRGDYVGALPLLQQAVQGLQGTGPSDPFEGYANYNLGYTLVALGRCSEGLTYLRRADVLEPGNGDVRRALARAGKC